MPLKIELPLVFVKKGAYTINQSHTIEGGICMTLEIDLANQLCFSIYNANRLFNKFYVETLTPFKLTYAQYLVLMALWERDDQSLHELGQVLRLSSNTLTPLLRRMEDAGWLQRERPATDRRQLVIHLTTQGKQQQAPIEAAIATCISRYHLTIDEYQQALALNQKIITALSQDLA
ncbi:HTH-type transcriptional regulator MgrA [Lactiplantibacillus plantarum]|nr:HTH-type transcriptional regulator MgrA [Lactiplantibacillus plantarum]MCG0660940.1 HTH-type transcriptional regulator MgrA [Lactiplantibacillus plantarum]